MIPLQARNIYRQSLKGARTAATYDSLSFDEIRDGHWVNVRHIAAWDETTDVALVLVYVENQTDSIPVLAIQLTDKTQPYPERCDFWIRGYDKLVFRFYDGANGDDLDAWVYGVEYVDPERIVGD